VDNVAWADPLAKRKLSGLRGGVGCQALRPESGGAVTASGGAVIQFQLVGSHPVQHRRALVTVFRRGLGDAAPPTETS